MDRREAASGTPESNVPDDGADPSSVQQEKLTFVAKADWVPTDPSQLRLVRGDTVQLLKETDGNASGGAQWWWVERIGTAKDVDDDTLLHDRGYIPSSYVRRSDETTDDRWQNDEYFGEYSYVKIHREMLADIPRTEAYRSAIDFAKSSGYLAGKVVLDIGCGTGILSMFAARAGARRVYAVEASDFADVTTKIIEDNGLSDVISVIHAEMESAQLPEQVDMIVSEWMGTLLIFEFMIESVIHARDSWLAPSGVVWPSSADLFFVPVRAEAEYQKKVGCWNSQYGFDMSRVVSLAQQEFLSRPKYNYDLCADDVMAEPATVFSVQMDTVTVDDLEDISAHVTFTIQRDCEIHGFGSWFTVNFDSLPGFPGGTKLDTGPNAPQTHWKQDLLMFDEPIVVSVGDVLDGEVRLKRNAEKRRHLRVSLDLVLRRGDVVIGKVKKNFPLWQ